jgi:hypothetical protein
MAENLAQADSDDFYYSPEERKLVEQEPTIVEASYHTEPGFEFLNLKLSDGRRLLIPKEELPELDRATAEQAKDIWLRAPYVSIWWPQIDDGIYLPDFLERRWARVGRAVAA